MRLPGICLIVIVLRCFPSCNAPIAPDSSIARDQIARAEHEFAVMAAQKGIAEAFSFFADSNAVIKRGNDSIIKGKAAIQHFYSLPFYKTASVQWSPDFIEVSASGDMAYTYGKYIWQAKDSSGAVKEIRGIFHTVWKKQADGNWKYVWD